jgi:Rad3-related DNA helicase
MQHFSFQALLFLVLTVLITSGTLSPLDMYPKILNFYPVTVQSFNMSMPRHRQCVLPLVRTVKVQFAHGITKTHILAMVFCASSRVPLLFMYVYEGKGTGVEQT